MSAPTPAPGDDRPREGYYPDPSIPGYVRYWNGSSWVPGTSRPAPKDGEPLSPPAGARPAAPSVEETGPHFFDEDPHPPASGPGSAPAASAPADRWPAAADAGQADRGGQDSPWGHSGAAGPADQAQWGRSGASGPAGQPDQGGQWDQSGPAGQPGRPGPWGRADAPGQPDPSAHSGQAGASVPGQGGPGGAWGADPRVAADGAAQPEGRAARTGGSAAVPPAEDGAPDPSTFMFRRPVPGPAAARADDGTTHGPVYPGQGGDPGSPLSAQGPAAAPAPPSAPSAPSSPATPSAGPGFSAGKAAAARAAGVQAPQSPPLSQAAVSPAVPPQAGPQQGAPAQAGPPATPLTSGAGGGQASWAQQVHRLAGGADEQPVAPWKPPVEDPFQAAARRQAAARPAGLGKRFAARLVDGLVVGAVTAAAAVPLGTRAVDHIQQKVDAAKLSGREVTVWLLDGTTGTCLGVVLAVLLLSGVVYEVLPTVKWGRTLGKKLCGLEVRDIEAHEPPTFGPALRRWLVYSVLGLLGIGVVGVLWCLFDRPWRQCWHDKAAHTFVAG